MEYLKGERIKEHIRSDMSCPSLFVNHIKIGLSFIDIVKLDQMQL